MANCFATSVGSKALTVKQAVVIASVCEFFGALLTIMQTSAPLSFMARAIAFASPRCPMYLNDEPIQFVQSQDIVDAAPHHVDLWSEMMVKLDLWKAPDPERVRNRAAASTHAVHATLPLSEVVANWDELAEALGGSVFEDMLA